MPPASAPVAELRKAVGLAQGGDWQAAHMIAQDYEGDPRANWIHAVCHRMEGDLSNAQYWYARCGHAYRAEVSTAEELAEIAAALENA